jgi:hypothetical protein
MKLTSLNKRRNLNKPTFTRTKAGKQEKPELPASIASFYLITTNHKRLNQLYQNAWSWKVKLPNGELWNSTCKAVIIIAVYRAKHCTTPIGLLPILSDLSSSIPNHQCHGALWILSTLYKISIQWKYSSMYLVTKINIGCPVLLNYLGLLCKFQTSASKAKIWMT